MASPNILIFGRGYLAERFQRYFGERAANSRVDITDLSALGVAIQEAQPHILLNAAAKTATGQIEKPENQAEAYRVNVQGPANLAYLARQKGLRLVQLSSFMGYDGAGPTGQGFEESDLPTPTNYYAWTKAWADFQLAPRAEMDGILIARLHSPLSKEGNPRNLLDKLRQFDQVIDQVQSLTVVEDLLGAVEQLIEKQATGIFHIANPGVISPAEIVTMMQDAGLIPAEKKIARLSQAELNQLTDAAGTARQTYPVVNTAKLQGMGIHLPEVHQAVQNCIHEFLTK